MFAKPAHFMNDFAYIIQNKSFDLLKAEFTFNSFFGTKKENTIEIKCT